MIGTLLLQTNEEEQTGVEDPLTPDETDARLEEIDDLLIDFRLLRACELDPESFPEAEQAELGCTGTGGAGPALERAELRILQLENERVELVEAMEAMSPTESSATEAEPTTDGEANADANEVAEADEQDSSEGGVEDAAAGDAGEQPAVTSDSSAPQTSIEESTSTTTTAPSEPAGIDAVSEDGGGGYLPLALFVVLCVLVSTALLLWRRTSLVDRLLNTRFQNPPATPPNSPERFIRTFEPSEPDPPDRRSAVGAGAPMTMSLAALSGPANIAGEVVTPVVDLRSEATNAPTLGDNDVVLELSLLASHEQLTLTRDMDNVRIGGPDANILIPGSVEMAVIVTSNGSALVHRTGEVRIRLGDIPIGSVAIPVTAFAKDLWLPSAYVDLSALVRPRPPTLRSHWLSGSGFSLVQLDGCLAAATGKDGERAAKTLIAALAASGPLAAEWALAVMEETHPECDQAIVAGTSLTLDGAVVVVAAIGGTLTVSNSGSDVPITTARTVESVVVPFPDQVVIGFSEPSGSRLQGELALARPAAADRRET